MDRSRSFDSNELVTESHICSYYINSVLMFYFVLFSITGAHKNEVVQKSIT